MQVSKLRLLGDYHHTSRIAFVEFVQVGIACCVSSSPTCTHVDRLAVQAESAAAALNCSGAILGTLPLRYMRSRERG